LLRLRTPNALRCQHNIERANEGTSALACAKGNRVIEVPNASTTAGQQLGLWDDNECICQHWVPAYFSEWATGYGHRPKSYPT
jgi:arabinan endo-1,5-alpha-L-arabinosidase